MSVAFSQGIHTVSQLSSQFSALWFRPKRIVDSESDRDGDSNHERFSIPGAATFGQQRLTFFELYERTANTGFEARADILRDYRFGSPSRGPTKPL